MEIKLGKVKIEIIKGDITAIANTYLKPSRGLFRAINCADEPRLIVGEYKIDSIAFPAISRGAFVYPIKEADRVVKETIEEIIPGFKDVKKIRFILFSQKDFEIYERIFLRES